jgi:hypothetical protein
MEPLKSRAMPAIGNGKSFDGSIEVICLLVALKSTPEVMGAIQRQS